MQSKLAKEKTPHIPDAVEQWKRRLDSLGIGMPQQLWSLTVHPGADVELRRDNPRFADSYVSVTVRDVEHFLELVGPGPRLQTKEEPRSVVIPRHLKVTTQSDTHRRASEIVARGLMGELTTLTGDERHLANSWLSTVKDKQTIALFVDIYIAERASLLLGNSTLFARHITIERGGRLLIPPNSHTKIDCASIEGRNSFLTATSASAKFTLIAASL